MPAARFWRIVGIETYAGGDLELSELHLHGVSGRVDAAAAFHATVPPKSGAVANLQDDDTETTCCFAAAAVRSSGFGFVWDFGVAAVEAIGVHLAAAGSESTFLAACMLQYSTDGATWVYADRFNRYTFPGEGQYTNPPAIGNPFYPSVSTLLNFQGADNSTVFADGSLRPKSFAAVGSAKISNAQSVFGGTSAYFNGSNGAVKTAHHLDFSFGTGDFTVEAWVWQTGPISQWREIFMINTHGALNIMLYDGRLAVDREGIAQVYGSSFAIPQQTWQHVEVGRRNGVIYGFVGGILVFSGPLADDFSHVGEVSIGGRSNGINSLSGYIGALQVTKGIALHVESFLPPARLFPMQEMVPGSTEFSSPRVAAAGPMRPAITAAAPVVSACVNTAFAVQTAVDVEFGGQGAIYGTVELHTPAGNIPLPRRVRLHRSRDGLLARETWSDVQGNYRFDGITGRYKYDAIAWDHESLQQSVVANDQTPEPMQ